MGNQKPLPIYTNFLFSALSGVGATLVCYPLDLLKTRMQVFGKGKNASISTIELAKLVIKNEGVRGLYSGLSASCVRQATYTGVRMGGYQTLISELTQDGKSPNLMIKCICGCISGAMGGIAGLPADVVLTRMAVDSMVPPEKRRNYRGVFSAMARISREEGPSALFRGFSTVIVRAMVVNVAQLVSYNQAKEIFLKSGLLQDNTFLHVTCSVISAFVATTCVLPPDIAKTRIQNMRIIDGKREYSGMFDVWKKIVAKEGVLSLWKGFTPLFLRNGPQFVVVFVIYEQLSALYTKHAT